MRVRGVNYVANEVEISLVLPTHRIEEILNTVNVPFCFWSSVDNHYWSFPINYTRFTFTYELHTTRTLTILHVTLTILSVTAGRFTYQFI